MLSFSLFLTILVYLASATDPIVQLVPKCPRTVAGVVMLELRAEVSAYALANCKNGQKDFITSNDVQHRLLGALDEHYIGHDCLLYKRYGANIFSVEIEVGWGEENSPLITNAEMHTVTCNYDDNGQALSSSDYVSDGFVAPGDNKANQDSRATSPKFDLTLVDVLDNPITLDKLAVGRKVRLQAIDRSNSVPAFRAVSCVAKSGDLSYDILTNGCGDGKVFDKVAGFDTIGHSVYSPYFDAFKLEGSDSIHFECNFTVCSSGCDGDSCLAEMRKRYNLDSQEAKSVMDSYVVTAASNHIMTEDMEEETGRVAEADFYWETSASDSSERRKVLGFRLGDKITKFLLVPEDRKGLSKRAEIEIVGVLCIMSPFLLISLIMCLYLCCSQSSSKRHPFYNGRLGV